MALQFKIFSSPPVHVIKLRSSGWIDNWEDVRKAHEADDLAFGTIESRIAYVSLEPSFHPPPRTTLMVFRQNLLGGVSASQHVIAQHPHTRMGSCAPALLWLAVIDPGSSRFDERGIR